ncbi:hypothetical protein Hanom_Chr00s002088g01691631 [Helianthus anomalus]
MDMNKVCMSEVLAGDDDDYFATRGNDNPKLKGREFRLILKVYPHSDEPSRFRHFDLRSTLEELLNLKDLFVTLFIDELQRRISLEMLVKMMEVNRKSGHATQAHGEGSLVFTYVV